MMPGKKKISSAIGIDLGGTRIKGVVLHKGQIINHVYALTGEGDIFKQIGRASCRERVYVLV